MGADKREDDLCLRVFSLNEDRNKIRQKNTTGNNIFRREYATVRQYGG